MRNIILQYSKDMSAGRLARGFDHCNRVYHLAKQLEDIYDDEVLYASTYLHDIILAEPHQLQSAEKAEAVLHEVGFKPGKIELVKEAILNHIPEGNPSFKEAKMLHDADILDSLGMVGITRLAIGAFFWKGAKSLFEVVNLIKEYKERAVSHFILEKSKKLAQEKIDFMEKALKQLEKEVTITTE
ncbi:MAG TPA: HD domain-containing protein [Spirochaetes bacterium]|nr:HD domain-containing protein [Spirochaetota bacterium]